MDPAYFQYFHRTEDCSRVKENEETAVTPSNKEGVAMERKKLIVLCLIYRGHEMMG